MTAIVTSAERPAAAAGAGSDYEAGCLTAPAVPGASVPHRCTHTEIGRDSHVAAVITAGDDPNATDAVLRFLDSRVCTDPAELLAQVLDAELVAPSGAKPSGVALARFGVDHSVFATVGNAMCAAHTELGQPLLTLQGDNGMSVQSARVENRSHLANTAILTSSGLASPPWPCSGDLSATGSPFEIARDLLDHHRAPSRDALVLVHRWSS